MRSLFRYLRSKRHSYSPLISVLLSGSRLMHNFSEYERFFSETITKKSTGEVSGVIAPVLKANAYGHGLKEIASILDKSFAAQRIPFLVVDSYHEALILRNEKINLPILIIGFAPPQTILQCTLKDVSFCFISLEQIKAVLPKLRRSHSFHLKIDTGMNRQGITPLQITETISIFKSFPQAKLIGLCTHLSDSQNDDASFTEVQINVWNNAQEQFEKEKHFNHLQYFHVAATNGVFHSHKIKANVVRLGIGLYGISESQKRDQLPLMPVMEIRTQIASVKKVSAGETIGYSGTFIAPAEMTIATLPLGYNEGVDRRLSNNGFVKVGRRFCPIIGNVSMDITTIDVTGLKGAGMGTPVTVLSAEPSDKNSLQNWTILCDTIPYELMVHVSPTLHRVIVSG